MNRKEILNMPAGREMDLLVIEEVLKWKFRYSTLFFNEGALDHFVDDKGDSRILGFSPSTDISAAWEVVEKFIWNSVEELKVSIMFYDDVFHCDLGQNIKTTVEAPTAPLAICRAALLAVMVL